MIEPLIKAAMYPYSLLFVTTPIMYMIMSHMTESGYSLNSGLTQYFLLTMQREISTLLARSFFMKFSLTILAVIARIRVLIQQVRNALINWCEEIVRVILLIV